MPTPNAHHFAAGIRSDGVRNATGRDWQGWFALLDEAGARLLNRQEITSYLQDQQGLSGWWSRMVTAGYEQARGQRPERVRPSSHTASRSKTIRAPVARLYRAWAADGDRAQWLPGYSLLIRKATPERSMRITWTDGISGLNVFFIEKAQGVSEVRVHHVNLADASKAKEMRAFWSGALDQLQGFLKAGDESAIDL